MIITIGAILAFLVLLDVIMGAQQTINTGSFKDLDSYYVKKIDYYNRQRENFRDSYEVIAKKWGSDKWILFIITLINSYKTVFYAVVVTWMAMALLALRKIG
jgi:hypothetical protein